MRRSLLGLVVAGLALATTLIAASTGSAAGVPTSCPSAAAVSLLLTDLPACLGSDLPSFGRDEAFRQRPDIDYRGLYSGLPAPLPLPAGCTTELRGTWTQDTGLVNRISSRDGHPVFEVSTNFHWATGIGAGARSVSMGDFWRDPSGVLVYVSRELFEGSSNGVPGSATMFNLAHIDPTGAYVGRGYVIGATEGLAGLRADGLYVGRLGQGGHWLAGSRWCAPTHPRTTASAAARSSG